MTKQSEPIGRDDRVIIEGVEWPVTAVGDCWFIAANSNWCRETLQEMNGNRVARRAS